MKQTLQIESEDLAWLKQELGYQLRYDQSKLLYANPKLISLLKENIERQSRILEALTGQDAT